MKKKKLQVFISSTFTDLISERQSAVQAVLSSGHIPAGMELFTAGDESQMNVIRRWIEESDVYLLILGGRYGSLEPTTEKSYTHLEYEYAVELNKPVFAVVISEEALEAKVKKNGTSVIEQENHKKLKSFRAEVLTKLVKFFEDSKDIKLAVHETMSEFSRREKLVGWVRSNEDIDTGNLAEELARLAKENSELREQLYNNSKTTQHFSGLTFEELLILLKRNSFNLNKTKNPDIILKIKNSLKHFKDNEPNLLHFIWAYQNEFSFGISYDDLKEFSEEIATFEKYNLLDWDSKSRIQKFTNIGRDFNLRLELEYDK
jgi:hypothetical protein